PNPGACTFTNEVFFDSGTHFLRPGVYCGGIRVQGTAKLHLEAGLYTIKDSPFAAVGESGVTGEDVTLYFFGRDSRLNLRGNAEINLAAPRTGDYAGILMMQQRMCRSTDGLCAAMYDGKWDDVDEIIEDMSADPEDERSTLEDLCESTRYREALESMGNDLCANDPASDDEEVARDDGDDDVDVDDKDRDADDRDADDKGNRKKYAETLGFPGMFRIEATGVERLLGTLYLPSAHLLIDADAPVAERSEYTAIVSRKLTLNRGPNLHLNADYAATSVPVPKGIGPVVEVRLAQ
ncbi:MAG: hypothetical protein AAF619_07885, partial [Pseudomonadota bacterium]